MCAKQHENKRPGVFQIKDTKNNSYSSFKKALEWIRRYLILHIYILCKNSDWWHPEHRMMSHCWSLYCNLSFSVLCRGCWTGWVHVRVRESLSILPVSVFNRVNWRCSCWNVGKHLTWDISYGVTKSVHPHLFRTSNLLSLAKSFVSRLIKVNIVYFTLCK